MKNLLRNKKIIWISLCSLFLVAGCSRFFIQKAYRAADGFILKWIDDYFDISKEQKNVLKRQIAPHMQWHQTSILPQYEKDLILLRAKIADGVIQAEEIDWLWERLETHRTEFFNHWVSDAAVFLATLTPEQVKYFQEKTWRDDQEIEKKLKIQMEKRLEKRRSHFVESAEKWLGSLSAQQKEAIANIQSGLPDVFSLRYEQDKQYQVRFLSLLQKQWPQKQEQTASYAAFLQDWVEAKKNRSKEHQEAEDAWRLGMQKIILTLDQTASREQRQHLLQKIDDYTSIVHSLQ